MSFLRYLKRIFLGKERPKDRISTQVQTESTVKEPEQIVREKIPVIPEKRFVNITIGLDFGTSTTKCIVNFEGEDNGKDKFLAIAFQ